jgi:cytidylate kinase
VDEGVVTPEQIIAIDGPGGSGKSTVATAVAERLGFRHLDTGAMYRAVTLLALREGTVGDEKATAALARDMSLEVDGKVMLDGEDVTTAIRSPEVDAAVSQVSAHAGVRAQLVERQRAWVAGGGGAVVEGRDIGSVVFPDARLKIYLTADPEERVRRRLQQLGPWSDERVPVASHTAASLARRDDLDATRTSSPLKVAEGAIVVDSTGRSVDDVVEEVLSYL